MAGSEPWLTLRRDLDQCRAACNRAGLRLWVAHEGAEPCGFLLLHPSGVAGSPYIASIAVAPPRRGTGAGSRLLDFAERISAGNAGWIFLCVSSFNTDARRFYERHGYRQVGEFPGYVIDGASEILMQKRLANA
jgi:ribosomal protein S18 acetylase RimI-like enzyme